MIHPSTLCCLLLLVLGAIAEPPAEVGIANVPEPARTNTASLAAPESGAAAPVTPFSTDTVSTSTNAVTGQLPAPSPLESAGPEVEAKPEITPPQPPQPQVTKEDLIEAARESLAPSIDAVAIRIDALEHSLAARYQDTMSTRLEALEQTLLAQHRDSVAATRDTTRMILLVAGCFSTAVLLGVLMGSLIMARAVQRMSEVVVSILPPSRQLAADRSLTGEEEPGALTAPRSEPVQEVTHRFLGAIEKLEHRIAELEHTSQGGLSTETPSTDGNGEHPADGGNGGPLEFSVSALSQKQYGSPSPATEPPQPDPHDQAALWIGKGQALLNLGNAKDALSCFDKALEAGPQHAADAYVKRGLALERLEKMEDALESYNLAIGADEAMTLAYLYKGAVCNRLQRYREALDCYENALRCEQKLAEH